MSQSVYGASSLSARLGDDDGGGGGGHGLNAQSSNPAAVTNANEAADDTLSIPPLFSILSSLRQQNLRSWPRQRRRNSKLLHHDHHKLSQVATDLQVSSNSLKPVKPQQIQLPLSPSQPAYLQHRSQDTERQQKLTRLRQHIPYPLNADQQESSPSRSPLSLPSTPLSTPPSTDLPKEVEQLAGELSRHHLQRVSIRPGIRNSNTSSNSTSLNTHRYRDAMSSFSPGMAELHLRNGGYAPVADLEVDMDEDNCNDTDECQNRLLSPTSLPNAPSLSETSPTSSYAVSTNSDAGPLVPLSLLCMQRRRAALADTSVRHSRSALTPFARQITPEADESLTPQQSTDLTPEMTPEMTDASTVISTTTTRAVSTPAAASIGAAALAAASPLEADNENLPPPPEDAMAAVLGVGPYSQHFQVHSQSLFHSEHSQSTSLSSSIPCSRPHSRRASDFATGGTLWNARSANYLPLSTESLALPHLAPLHNDVPSSGYDLRGWLSSSSTVESVAALTTGATIDNRSGPLSANVGNAVPLTDATTKGTMPSNEQAENRNSEHCPSAGDTTAPPTTQANARQQQNRRFYTAYLHPQNLPFYRKAAASSNASRHPNPRIDVLEVDMEESGSSVDLREEFAPATAAASYETGHGGHNSTCPQNGPYMDYPQRIFLIQRAIAREAERAHSRHSTDGSSTAGGSISVACNDMMEVDMADQPLDKLLASLPEDGEVGDFHKYMGPFRYRLTPEVAMRCTNLVRNKPRMRRRRPSSECSETNDSASNTHKSSTQGSRSLHGERRRERHQERRDLGRDTYQDSRERQSRAQQRREHTRLAEEHTQALANADSLARIDPSSPPSQPLSIVQADGALLAIPEQVTTTRSHQDHPRMEQYSLPIWKVPHYDPVEAIDAETL